MINPPVPVIAIEFALIPHNEPDEVGVASATPVHDVEVELEEVVEVLEDVEDILDDEVVEGFVDVGDTDDTEVVLVQLPHFG